MWTNPPKAEAHWSCIPIVSPISFCSISIANLASLVLPRNSLLTNADNDVINPTVKADELPIPLLDGKSPTWVISMFFPCPYFLITSLAVGWLIWSISLTFSIFE